MVSHYTLISRCGVLNVFSLYFCFCFSVLRVLVAAKRTQPSNIPSIDSVATTGPITVSSSSGVIGTLEYSATQGG